MRLIAAFVSLAVCLCEGGEIDDVRHRLKQMAAVDQQLRHELVEGVVNSTGTPAEKLSFLCSQINLKRESLSPEEDGLIEKLDREHYAALKAMMSGALKEEGWPVISKFGKEADFHAWLICQHASFDRQWQQTVLLPRLKKLLEKGEINPAGYAWLSDPSEENLDAMEKMLAVQGDPWNSMIPKIHQMRAFFTVVKPLLN
jgi:hypothetical protein